MKPPYFFRKLVFGWVAGVLVPVSGAYAQAAPAPATRPAATGFSGRITDQASGEGLPGATILFPDLKQGITTDATGTFQFSNLPRGRFLMQVRYVGYNTVSQTIDTGSGQPLDMKLSVAATEIGQVVVTGVSQATELRRSPIPTTVVDRQRLNQTASSNIIDAIAHTPGVSQITTGAAISKPVIRGLSSTRVITLNNGAKQEGQQWGDEHGIEMDEYSIDRAEIIKGPGSLLYGSDGMAGVVNFLAPDPVDEGHITGQLLANYQTNNHLQGYSVQNAGNLNGLNWLVRSSSKKATAYRNSADGRVFNSGFNENAANGYVGLNKSWGYSHLTFSTYNQNLGLTEGTRNAATGRFTHDVDRGLSVETVPVSDADLRGYGLAVPRQVVNHLRFGTDNNFILGDQGGRLTLQVSYQENQRREFGNVLDPYSPGLYFDLKTVDYSLRYFLPETHGWNFTTGLSGLHQQNQNLGREFLIPAYRTNEGGVFGVARRTFGRLDLSGGLRYDVRRISAEALYLDAFTEQPVPAGTAGADTKFGGFTSTFQNVSGSVGGSFSATDQLVLKANLSRGFRAPNIAELGSNGRHEGTIRYEIGSPDLKPETSLQADLGASYVTDHVSLSLNAFENQISNYIFPRKLESVFGGDSSRDQNPVFRYEQGTARLYGGEASIDLHPHPLDWLHLETAFSMVRAVQLNQPENSKYLPFIPADRLQTELRVQSRGEKGHLAHAFAFVQVEHTFAQNRFFSAFNTETATAAYTLTNAGLGGDITNGHGRTWAQLFLTGNNIFDVAYQSHLSRLKYADYNAANGRTGVFNIGRNISLKLVVPLRLK